MSLSPQSGGLAEWSIAAVLKTVKPQGFGGSNPSPSAIFYVSKLLFGSNLRIYKDLIRDFHTRLH
jgi:hypothetical protein